MKKEKVEEGEEEKMRRKRRGGEGDWKGKV